LTPRKRPTTTMTHMFKPDQKLTTVFLHSLIFCLTVGFVALLFLSRSIILAGITGVGVGCLASPFLTFMQRKFKIPRAVGALILILILSLIFAGVAFLAGRLVANQLDNFQQQLPYFIEKIHEWKAHLLKHYPAMTKSLSDLSVTDNLKEGVLRIINGLGTGMSAAVGLTLAFFIALYTAINSHRYYRDWIEIFPGDLQNRVAHLSRKSAKVLRVWFSAQLIDMAIVGVISAFGLWLVGFNYWAVFGLMSAVFAIIPYFGTLITLLSVALVTAAEQPDLFFWVLLVFFITQQIEGNVILPLIMKERVKLPEAPLLFFIVLMSFWFGVLGIIVAPGLFAIGRTLYVEISKT